MSTMQFSPAVISGPNGWSVPSAGFSNPMYLAGTVTDATGFDISGYGSVAIAFEGTYTGQAVVHEQTLDPTGATGWFTVTGVGASQGSSSTSATSTGATSGQAYIFPVRGVRQRARLTALSTGTLVARVGLQVTRAELNVAGVIGPAAHDAAISGSPVRIGGRARGTNVAAVAADDAADFITTFIGALLVRPYALPDTEWHYPAAASGIVNTTTAVTIAAAGGAGLRNYITSIEIQHATLGAATELAIRDGAGGAVLWRTLLATTAMPLTSIPLPSPLKGTAATLLEVVTLTAVTGAVYVNAHGFVAP